MKHVSYIKRNYSQWGNASWDASRGVGYYSTSETKCKKNLKRISEHVPYKKSIFDLTDEEFGFYLAGLIDSDGYISIQNQIIITFCLNDQSFAYSLKKRIGFGNVHKIKNKNAYNLIISNTDGILKIINLINGKLRLEIKVLQLENLKQKDIIQKVDNHTLLTNTYWLAGFTDGDGSFQIKIRNHHHNKKYSLNNKLYNIDPIEKDNVKKPEIALNYQIALKKDIILKQIKNIFEGGYLGHRKKDNTYYYESTCFDLAYKFIQYFDKYQLQSTKYLNYLYWRNTYILIQDKHHFTWDGIKKIETFKNSMNNKLIVSENPDFKI